MTALPTPGPVTVGVDGSKPGLRAVEWAAEEAWLRRVALRLVAVAPSYDTAAGTGAETRAGGVLTALPALRRVTHDLAEARRLAVQLHPDLAVTTHVRTGDVAAEFVAAAAGSSALVVADGRSAALDASPFRSVADRVAEEAGVPVVVVRAVPNTAERPSVVLGLDASGACAAAMAYAFDVASRRRLSLTAVHAWTPPSGGWAALAGETDVYDVNSRILAQHLAGWREAFPDVVVTRRLAQGSPSAVLLGASRTASLVVVGRHVRPTAGASPTGSTTCALLHAASCPVAVVRST